MTKANTGPAPANTLVGPTGKHRNFCEHGTCQELAIREFGVMAIGAGKGKFTPTRSRLRLCQRHYRYMTMQLPGQPEEVEMVFLRACGLVPASEELEGLQA